MGHKTNPIANRIGVIFGWKSMWMGNYSKGIKEDYEIRKYIYNEFPKGGISNIYIEKICNKFIITICTSKPAIVIGKKGEEVDKLKNEILYLLHKCDVKFFSNFKNKTNYEIHINVLEIKYPDLDSFLVSDSIAKQIENRISYKKAIKLYLNSSIKYGAYGIKIQVSGRLNGAEMARTELYKNGSIKLSSLRSNIDYSCSIARTIYGIIGVKVWIMKGEIYSVKKYVYMDENNINYSLDSY